MGRLVIHKGVLLKGRRFGVEAIVATTLCGRMRTQAGDNGFNSSSKNAEVTCKFCLQKIANAVRQQVEQRRVMAG